MKGTSVIIDPLCYKGKSEAQVVNDLAVGTKCSEQPWYQESIFFLCVKSDLLLLLPHLAGYLYMAAITLVYKSLGQTLSLSCSKSSSDSPLSFTVKVKDLRRTCKTLCYLRHTFYPTNTTVIR